VPLTRRDLLNRFFGGAALSMCGAPHEHASGRPTRVGFEHRTVRDRSVYRIGPRDGAPIMLLHELPGLTADDLALARRLADERFNVYTPLLFGDFGQNSVLAGHWQACRDTMFECSKRSARSEILDWLEPAVDWVAADANAPVGVIGMCLTGILPVAMLRPSVRAAVLCQPTIPFSVIPPRPTGKQKSDLGLGRADLDRAVASDVPFLAIRYTKDPRCPRERMDLLTTTFKDRVAVIEVDGEHCHSTLGGNFNLAAFEDAVRYLRVRLKVTSGPIRMNVAQLNGQACQMTAAGTWSL